MKQTKQSLFTCLLAITCLLLSSCGRKYHPQSLTYPMGAIKEKDQVELAVRPLNDNECKTFFDRKIVSRGFQPIQIHIKNKSDTPYHLRASDINLPLEKITRVTRKLHTNTFLHVAGWSAAATIGLPFTPLYPLFIVAALDGYDCFKVNKKISEDIQDRALNPTQVLTINPHSQISKVVFISSKNYLSTYQNFNLSLTSLDNKHRINFDI